MEFYVGINKFNHRLILHVLKYKISIDFALGHRKTSRTNLLKMLNLLNFLQGDEGRLFKACRLISFYLSPMQMMANKFSNNDSVTFMRSLNIFTNITISWWIYLQCIAFQYG